MKSSGLRYTRFSAKSDNMRLLIKKTPVLAMQEYNIDIESFEQLRF